MSTVRVVTASNQETLSRLQPAPRVVVAGGTSGIGRAIALAYHRYCPDAHVTIIGRNESAANEILSQLGSNGKFVRADLSLMSEIRTLKEQIKAVDVLILSQGVIRLGDRAPTKENIDDRLALNYYGRVLLVNEFLPLLRASPLGGKVLFILNGKVGNPSKVNWNDMALETSYSILSFANHTATFTDLAIQYLASQPENATITFTHAYPGLVDTSISRSLPFYVRWPMQAAVSIGGTSAEDCAEFMIHGMLTTEKGWRCVDSKGELVSNKPEVNEDMLKKVWDHTNEITSRTG